MAKKGGQRPGAGRKKGTLVTRSQEIVAKASKEGISPLEVMLNDMRFYYNLGEEEFKKIKGREVLEECFEIFKRGHGFKAVARECATMAAPYIHPKLANINAQITVSNQETALAELE
jgi:hypothetical protein